MASSGSSAATVVVGAGLGGGGGLWKSRRDGLIEVVRSLIHQLASVERGFSEAQVLVDEHRALAAEAAAQRRASTRGESGVDAEGAQDDIEFALASGRASSPAPGAGGAGTGNNGSLAAAAVAAASASSVSSASSASGAAAGQQRLAEVMPAVTGGQSRLSLLVPQLGRFFTPLDLRAALQIYDAEYGLSARRHVAPSFSEVRHILNLAQLDASAAATGPAAPGSTTSDGSGGSSGVRVGGVRLMTFDADGTLYSDGANLESDSDLLEPMIALLRRGVHVAVVTAAGYPGAPERYAVRFRALLDQFRERKLPSSVTSRFLVVGGECNYLLRVTDDFDLEEVDHRAGGASAWMPESFRVYDDHEPAVKRFLDETAAVFVSRATAIGLAAKMTLIRKPRAVGYIPKDPSYAPRKEMLNELVFEAQAVIEAKQARQRCKAAGYAPPPGCGEPTEADDDIVIDYCAFNGGTGVWCDVGHKAIAIRSLQKWLGVTGAQTLHVGDQMDALGNDIRARAAAPTLWVASPAETRFLLTRLLAHGQE